MAIKTNKILNVGQKVLVDGKWQIISEVMHSEVAHIYDVTFRFGQSFNYKERNTDKIYNLGQILRIKHEDIPSFDFIEDIESRNNEREDFIKRFCTGFYESNNKVELSLADLEKSISYFYNKIMMDENRQGLPRLTFHDEKYNETYCLRVEKSNLGYSVSGTLNNAIAYQLNSRFFDFDCKVKEVVNEIAGGNAFA